MTDRKHCFVLSPMDYSLILRVELDENGELCHSLVGQMEPQSAEKYVSETNHALGDSARDVMFVWAYNVGFFGVYHNVRNLKTFATTPCL